ncbi:MAG TPA: hypothetical protein VMV92_11845 [Streptosporangiaceae bacterium]|nr:hypothetical protein [Streptosporangiaceae bacterium]
MTGRYDEHEHRTAARLTRDNPRWLILWGTWTRLYWAFACFHVLPGTILTAAAPGDLITGIRRAELAASQQATPRYTTPPPH